MLKSKIYNGAGSQDSESESEAEEYFDEDKNENRSSKFFSKILHDHQSKTKNVGYHTRLAILIESYTLAVKEDKYSELSTEYELDDLGDEDGKALHLKNLEQHYKDRAAKIVIAKETRESFDYSDDLLEQVFQVPSPSCKSKTTNDEVIEVIDLTEDEPTEISPINSIELENKPSIDVYTVAFKPFSKTLNAILSRSSTQRSCDPLLSIAKSLKQSYEKPNLSITVSHEIQAICFDSKSETPFRNCTYKCSRVEGALIPKNILKNKIHEIDLHPSISKLPSITADDIKRSILPLDASLSKLVPSPSSSNSLVASKVGNKTNLSGTLKQFNLRDSSHSGSAAIGGSDRFYRVSGFTNISTAITTSKGLFQSKNFESKIFNKSDSALAEEYSQVKHNFSFGAFLPSGTRLQLNRKRKLDNSSSSKSGSSAVLPVTIKTEKAAGEDLQDISVHKKQSLWEGKGKLNKCRRMFFQASIK